MKKTLLILAAIFIATNLFSQDLDSLLNKTINDVNKVFIDNGEEPIKIDNGVFKRAAEDDLKSWEQDKKYVADLIEFSEKHGVVIPYIRFVSGPNKDELVTKIVKVINDGHFKTSSRSLDFGFAITTNGYYYYINIVIGYPGDIKKTCYYNKSM
jgi:hypothetical protein